jgi:hypothetical protein
MGSEKRATKPVGESVRTGYVKKLTNGFPDSTRCVSRLTSSASTPRTPTHLSATQRPTPLICPMTLLLLTARVDIRAIINLTTDEIVGSRTRCE